MFKGLENIFKSLSLIANAIKEAFKQIFPQKTAEELANFTKGFEKFTEKLVPSEETLETITAIFKGLFSVLKLVTEAAKIFIKAILKLGEILKPVGKAILDAASALGKWVTSLADATNKSGAFEKIWEGAKSFFEKIGELITKATNKIREFFGTFKNNEAEGAKKVSEGMVEAVSPLAKIGEVFNKLGEAIKTAWNKIKQILSDGFNFIKTITSKIKASLEYFFGELKFDNIIHVLKEIIGLITSFHAMNIVRGISGITKGLSDGSQNLGKALEGLAGFFSNLRVAGAQFAGVFTDIRASIQEWKKEKSIEILKEIATSLLIVAGALFIVSKIDKDKITASFVAISALFGEIFAYVAIADKMVKKDAFDGGSLKKMGIAMLEMSATLLILASAMKKIGSIDPERTWNAIGVIAALMVELVIAMKVLSTDGEKQLTKGASNMFMLALSVKALTSVVSNLGSIDLPTLAKGLAGVIVLLVALSKTVNGMSNLKFGSGLGLVLLSTSLIIMTHAVKSLGEVKLPELVKGLLGLGAALAGIWAFTKYASTGIFKNGLGLIVVSTGILILAKALKSFGSIGVPELIKGLIGLGVALAAVTASLFVLGAVGGPAIAGAGALLIAGAALMVLAQSMKMMSSLEWGELGRAFVGIVGILATLGIAAVILAPAVPIMAALGGVLLLFGVSLLAIIAPLSLLVGIMGKLSEFGTAGAESLIQFLLKIGQIIPTIASQIALGVISFAESISTGGVAILNAATTIIGAILDALAINIPKFIETGMTLIMSLLKGIRDNIEEFVKTGVDIIVNFIKGIEYGLPKIVDEAFNLIIVFIDTLGVAIRDKTPILVDHIWDLAENICIGLWEGLKHFFGTGKEKITNFADSIIGALEDAFGIPHGSIKSAASKFVDMAGQIVNGIIQGLKNGVTSIGKSVKEVGDNIVQGFKNFFHIKSPSKVMEGEVGKFIAEGLAKGIGNSNAPEEASEEKSKNVIEVFKNLFNEESNEDIGSSVSTGIANGITQNTAPETAAKNKAQSIAEAFQKEINRIDLNTQLTDLSQKLWETSRTSEQRLLERALEDEYSKDNPNEAYILELEQRLQEMDNAKTEMQITQNRSNLSDLRKKEDLARKEYEAYEKAYGADSDEAKKAWNSYLQAQINTAEQANNLEELEYNYNKSKQELAEQQRQNNEDIENSYYEWIINNTKALKQVGYTNDQIKKAARDATGFNPDKQQVKMEELTKRTTLNSMQAVQETYQANAEETFGALNPEFESYGQEYGTNLAKGLESEKGLVIDESTRLSEGSLNALNDHTDEYYKAGQAAGKAYTEGLKTYSETVLNSTDGLGNKANSAISKAYTAKSKEMKEKYSDAINQIAKEKGVDVGVAWDMLKSDALYGTGKYSTDEMKKDYKELYDIATGASVETITKVLNANNEKSTIKTSSIKSSTSSSSARSVSSTVKSSSSSSSGSLSGSAGTTVNYTQNISSPKAVSTSEVYRQTKTMLSAVSGTIGGSIVKSAVQKAASKLGVAI